MKTNLYKGMVEKGCHERVNEDQMFETETETLSKLNEFKDYLNTLVDGLNKPKKKKPTLHFVPTVEYGISYNEPTTTLSEFYSAANSS